MGIPRKRNYKKEAESEANKYKKMTCRIPLYEWSLLHKVLEDAEWTYQDFMEACYKSLLRGDPNMMKVMKDYRVLSSIPQEVIDEYTISFKEREALLKEFEKEGEEL